MVTRYKWTIRFTLITPLLFVLVVVLMGGGHGTYLPAIFLFPWGMMGIVWENTITMPFINIALLQYPLYGMLLDGLKAKPNVKWFCFCLLGLHVALAMTVFALEGDRWR